MRDDDVLSFVFVFFFFFFFLFPKDISSFTTKSFLEEASSLFLSYHRALMAGDVAGVRDLVSPSMLTRAKQDMTRRELKPNETAEWSGEISAKKVLTMRFIPVDEMKLNFGHILVRFDSRQSLSLLREGVVAARTPVKERRDMWVFERATNRRDEKWRLCGTLPLAEGEKSLKKMQEEHEAEKKRMEEEKKKRDEEEEAKRKEEKKKKEQEEKNAAEKKN